GHVHLGGEPADSRCVDLEVNVRGAPGIGHRTDGAEAVAAVGCGLAAAVALEGGIAALQARLAWVIVDAVGIALPDFDHGAPDRLPPPGDATRTHGGHPA